MHFLNHSRGNSSSCDRTWGRSLAVPTGHTVSADAGSAHARAADGNPEGVPGGLCPERVGRADEQGTAEGIQGGASYVRVENTIIWRAKRCSQEMNLFPFHLDW